jgi:hypothetical protein
VEAYDAATETEGHDTHETGDTNHNARDDAEPYHAESTARGSTYSTVSPFVASTALRPGHRDGRTFSASQWYEREQQQAVLAQTQAEAAAAMLTESLRAKSDEAAALSVRAAELEGRLGLLQARCDAKDEQAAALGETQRLFLQTVQRERDTAADRCRTADERAADLQAELARMQRRAEDAEAARQRLQAEEERRRQAEALLAGKDGTVDSLSRRLVDAEEALARLRAELETRDWNCRLALDAEAGLRARLVSAEAEIATVRQDSRRLEGALSAELASARQESRRLEESLTVQLATARQESRRLEESHALELSVAKQELRRREESYATDLSAAKQKSRSVEESLTAELATAKEEVCRLQQSCASEVSAAKQRSHDLEESLGTELAAAKEEVRRLQTSASINVSCAEHTAPSRNEDALAAQLALAKQESLRLEEALAAAKADIEALRSPLALDQPTPQRSALVERTLHSMRARSIGHMSELTSTGLGLTRCTIDDSKSDDDDAGAPREPGESYWQRKVGQLEQQITQHLHKLHQTQTALQSSRQEVEATRALLDRTREHIATLENALASAGVDALQVRLKQETDAKESLQRQLATLEQTMASMTTDFHKNMNTIQRESEAANEALRVKMADLRDKAATAQTKAIEDLKAQSAQELDALEQECNGLKQRLEMQRQTWETERNQLFSVFADEQRAATCQFAWERERLIQEKTAAIEAARAEATAQAEARASAAEAAAKNAHSTVSEYGAWQKEKERLSELLRKLQKERNDALTLARKLVNDRVKEVLEVGQCLAHLASVGTARAPSQTEQRRPVKTERAPSPAARAVAAVSEMEPRVPPYPFSPVRHMAIAGDSLETPVPALKSAHTPAMRKHDAVVGKHDAAVGKDDPAGGKDNATAGKHNPAGGKQDVAIGMHDAPGDKHDAAVGEHDAAVNKRDAAVDKYGAARGNHGGANHDPRSQRASQPEQEPSRIVSGKSSVQNNGIGDQSSVMFTAMDTSSYPISVALNEKKEQPVTAGFQSLHIDGPTGPAFPPHYSRFMGSNGTMRGGPSPPKRTPNTNSQAPWYPVMHSSRSMHFVGGPPLPQTHAPFTGTHGQVQGSGGTLMLDDSSSSAGQSSATLDPPPRFMRIVRS